MAGEETQTEVEIGLASVGLEPQKTWAYKQKIGGRDLVFVSQNQDQGLSHDSLSLVSYYVIGTRATIEILSAQSYVESNLMVGWDDRPFNWAGMSTVGLSAYRYPDTGTSAFTHLSKEVAPDTYVLTSSRTAYRKSKEASPSMYWS